MIKGASIYKKDLRELESTSLDAPFSEVIEGSLFLFIRLAEDERDIVAQGVFFGGTTGTRANRHRRTKREAGMTACLDSRK